MKVVIAIDSFKGSLSSLQAGTAVLLQARENGSQGFSGGCRSEGGDGCAPACRWR